MRLTLIVLLGSIALSASASATPFATYESFDRSIAQAKQAMMGDPARALIMAEKSVAIAAALPPSPRANIAGATASWLQGEALIFVNRSTDAARSIDSALRTVERLEPGTKLHGDLLRSRGALEAANGRFLQALADYQRAHDVFAKTGERRSQALALQDIGSIYWDGGDYPRTIKYFDQAVDAYDGDPTIRLTLLNNRGEVSRKQKRYDEALPAYKAALQQARLAKSAMLQTRILTNLGGSEAEAGRLQSAQVAIDQAMALSSHGEAMGYQPFVFGVAAKIAFERGDVQRAKQMLTRTFAGINLERSEMLYRDHHETASRVYERLGEDAQAFAHLKAVQRIDSEAQALTASAASQLIAARFDFANQDLKISKLKEGQLKRDVALERERSDTRFILLIGLLAAGAVVVALSLFGFFSIRRSRNKVRDANAALSTVNGALETALKAKTEFLATTSHEIRTPLNGILGMTQVLLHDRTIRPDVRERIEVVHGAGETMRALVDDILDVAKMETGLLTVVHEAVDLHAVLSDASRLWSGQAQTKGVAVVVDIDTVPRQVMSDAGRLRQITFNLMSNAMKFTRDGSVKLVATVEEGGNGDEQLLIRVSDTGIGIPVDKLETIFEPFQQVDGGITRQYGGTGLGLAIVQNLVEALGGVIAVESTLGEGATFTVRLPLERVSTEAAGEADVVTRSLANASLLIVERDPARLGMLRMLLAAQVGETSAATDAHAAATALAGGRITLVLADADVADDDRETGSDLIELSQAATGAGAYLALLAKPGRDAELIALGATRVIGKPVTATSLVAALEDLYALDEELDSTFSEARLAA